MLICPGRGTPQKIFQGEGGASPLCFPAFPSANSFYSIIFSLLSISPFLLLSLSRPLYRNHSSLKYLPIYLNFPRGAGASTPLPMPSGTHRLDLYVPNVQHVYQRTAHDYDCFRTLHCYTSVERVQSVSDGVCGRHHDGLSCSADCAIDQCQCWPHADIGNNRQRPAAIIASSRYKYL